MTATALEHPAMEAHECLARAVAASNAREGVRGYSPEHQIWTASSSHENTRHLPTVQSELVDGTYGNNIKRMQDSKVNFLRHTCTVGAMIKRETKGPCKSTAPVLCTETTRDNEKGQLPLLQGAPTWACVWLSRAGRLMRADPTQLRLASVREDAYQEVHDSHPMPWTARGEFQEGSVRGHVHRYSRRF